MSDEKETRGDLPKCPSCGHENRDAWEIDFGPGLDGDAETWCHRCDAPLLIQRVVSVEYVTRARRATP